MNAFTFFSAADSRASTVFGAIIYCRPNSVDVCQAGLAGTVVRRTAALVEVICVHVGDGVVHALGFFGGRTTARVLKTLRGWRECYYFDLLVTARLRQEETQVKLPEERDLE